MQRRHVHIEDAHAKQGASIPCTCVCTLTTHRTSAGWPAVRWTAAAGRGTGWRQAPATARCRATPGPQGACPSAGCYTVHQGKGTGMVGMGRSLWSCNVVHGPIIQKTLVATFGANAACGHCTALHGCFDLLHSHFAICYPPTTLHTHQSTPPTTPHTLPCRTHKA